MKKVVAVTINDDGTIKGLWFQGNKCATPVKTVINMMERGRDIDFTETDLIVVNVNGKKHIRKKPNDTLFDNLESLPKIHERSFLDHISDWFFKLF
jgi:hypothetical protein